jgi:hypothetical protein
MIWSVTIIKDRYNGAYSYGKWTAWGCHHDDVPEEPGDDDVTCANFWEDFNGKVGLGETPNEALENLYSGNWRDVRNARRAK